MIEVNEHDSLSNKNNSDNSDCSRQKGRHPVVSLIISKQETDLCRAKVHNDISITYTVSHTRT